METHDSELSKNSTAIGNSFKMPSKAPKLIDYVIARVLSSNIMPMRASHLAAVISYLQSLYFIEKAHIWNHNEVFSISMFGAKLQYFEDRLYSGIMSDYFTVTRSFFGMPYISLTDRARFEIRPSSGDNDHTTLHDESSKAIARFLDHNLNNALALSTMSLWLRTIKNLKLPLRGSFRFTWHYIAARSYFQAELLRHIKESIDFNETIDLHFGSER